jgi:hypothetical protein
MKTMEDAGMGGRATNARDPTSPHSSASKWTRSTLRGGGLAASRRASSSTAAVPDALSSAPGRTDATRSGSIAKRVDSAEVIVMRADDDELAIALGIRAADERADVVSLHFIADEVLEVRDAARARRAPRLKGTGQPERLVAPREKHRALSLPAFRPHARQVTGSRDTGCRRRCRPA